MDKPTTRFTRSGPVTLAYQVFGDGPVDLVYTCGWIQNIDTVWEHPGYRRFLQGLASFSRVIFFDKRGTGMSERDVGVPTLEERADDIRAVMDATGSERATVLGISEGGNMTTMFAATHPERTRSIVLIGCFPCRAQRPDYPAGRSREDLERGLANLVENWGEPLYLDLLAPSVAGDQSERAFWARLITQSASPASAVAIERLNYELDIRPILPVISVPALVLHRRGEKLITVEEARFLAENLPKGRLVLLDGVDHSPWIGDTQAIIDEIRRFMLGPEATVPAASDRVLLSVLMTDIVGSTERAAKMGDASWRDTLAAHDDLAARAVARQDGTLVKSTGDGLLAVFAGPSRALACATDLHRAAKSVGLTLRAGVHAGECLRHGSDVTGLAVTIAARIMHEAGEAETWVSGTVRDLVIGSGREFSATEPRKLKGVPGDWTLHRVVR